MNPALRASAAHVFVDDLEVVSLSQDDTHHLFRVLRLRDGESVTASDGRGSWRTTIVAGGVLVRHGEVNVEPVDQPLTIAAAIAKGDRTEWMVQKLTELGVSEIVFLHCERSVVRWKVDRAAQQLARMSRVAREAAMQCRRVWLPNLRGPVDFAVAAALSGAVIADPDGEPVSSGVTGGASDANVVLIGPEGGLSATEFGLCPRSVSLGPHILRVETAAVAAAAILGRSRR